MSCFPLQPQVSNNFGANDSATNVSGAGNPNGTSADLFLRQGFMLVRNFVLPNLTLKAGRQLMVWGNHRIFGHFDWNNVGFAFDGVTMRYNHATVPVELGWLRVAEGNCVQNAGGCTNGKASKGDGDILFLRIPMKFGSVAIEPAYIYEDGGATTGAGSPGFGTGGQQSNQERSTVGGRVAFKDGMFDLTGEGYWQFGEIGPVGGASQTRINALAGHLDGGITLPVPMQPRVGFELNYATGSSNKDGGHTFSQLFPTNHIHFGYMDLMSWQNMVNYGGELAIASRPQKATLKLPDISCGWRIRETTGIRQVRRHFSAPLLAIAKSPWVVKLTWSTPCSSKIIMSVGRWATDISSPGIT